MSISYRILGALTVATLALPLATSAPALAKKGGGSALMMLDPDKDGTVDLKEVQAAAEASFAKLDPDNDGTLDAKELKGRISKAEMKQADPDADGTLDKKEFLALAESLFKAADPDGDGTLDAKELKSKPGKALVRLLK